MNTFGIHLATRCKTLASTPSGWMFVFGLACFASLMFLPLLKAPDVRGILGGVLAAFGLPPFAMLFGLMVMGQATWSGQGRRREIVHPHHQDVAVGPYPEMFLFVVQIFGHVVSLNFHLPFPFC